MAAHGIGNVPRRQGLVGGQFEGGGNRAYTEARTQIGITDDRAFARLHHLAQASGHGEFVQIHITGGTGMTARLITQNSNVIGQYRHGFRRQEACTLCLTVV